MSSLQPPAGTPQPDPRDWMLVARTRRVNRDWEKLIGRAPESAARWYRYLRSTPMQRWPGRVFPLRHPAYAGAWECEVTDGDRIYYVPHEDTRTVEVYYAGPHIRPAPRP